MLIDQFIHNPILLYNSKPRFGVVFIWVLLQNQTFDYIAGNFFTCVIYTFICKGLDRASYPEPDADMVGEYSGALADLEEVQPHLCGNTLGWLEPWRPSFDDREEFWVREDFHSLAALRF